MIKNLQYAQLLRLSLISRNSSREFHFGFFCVGNKIKILYKSFYENDNLIANLAMYIFKTLCERTNFRIVVKKVDYLSL